MTKRKNLFITIFLVVGTFLVLGIYQNEGHTDTIAYKVFSEDGGWGYDILKNGEVVIHQDKIPVVQQRKSFATESQARAAAELVIKKIKESKAPAISKDEVEQIMLKYK